MRAELLCSCGLLLEHAGSRILIDAPNGTIPPFYEFPDAEMQKLLDGTGVYSGLCGVFFTHLHPDHYDEARVNALLCRRGALTTFLPDKQMPETITRTAGPFTVECRRFPHMPAPKFPDVAHYVLLVTAGGRSVYITADAVPDAAAHRAVLHARRPQLAFWNSQSLSYPDMRALLREETERDLSHAGRSGRPKRHPAQERTQYAALWRGAAECPRPDAVSLGTKCLKS